MSAALPLRRALAAALALLATLAGAPASAEVKVALVIGNAAYPTAPLRNPVNDATAMAERLRALGFDVTLLTNVTQREMTRAVSRFGEALKPGSVGLFYYAGHGMQVRGRNFLVPVDAQIQSEASARSEAVDLDLVLEQLGPSRLSMVILDACRNNPFEGRFRSGGGGGLAQVDAPKGTLLAYATAPGKVASDGEGSHGLYTSELLKAMQHPRHQGRGSVQGRARQRDQGHGGPAGPVGIVLADGRLLLPARARVHRDSRRRRDAGAAAGEARRGAQAAREGRAGPQGRDGGAAAGGAPAHGDDRQGRGGCAGRRVERAVTAEGERTGRRERDCLRRRRPRTQPPDSAPMPPKARRRPRGPMRPRPRFPPRHPGFANPCRRNGRAASSSSKASAAA